MHLGVLKYGSPNELRNLHYSLKELIMYQVAIWVTDILLILLLTRQARTLWKLRRVHSSIERDKIINNAHDILDKCMPIADALNAWEQIDASPTLSGGLSLIESIRILSEAPIGTVDSLREQLRPIVNHLNSFAALIDDQLIQLSDVIPYRELDMDSFIWLTTMTEPLIWHDALIANRGRWAYRVVRMRDIAKDLVSMTMMNQGVRVIECPLGQGRRREIETGETSFFVRIGRKVVTPSITTRTKVAQNRYVDKLRDELINAGFRLPEEQIPVAW